MLGAACGLFSAVGYTAANVCLRAVSHCDPVWVSAVKAYPTLLFVGPWLVVLVLRGQRVLPPWRVLAILAVAGLLAQLGGNVLFQWSLGVIGIALAVPITLGSMIVGGAILGRIFLGEGITPRAILANTVLLAAIVILSASSRDPVVNVANPLMAERAVVFANLGVIAALICGLLYATLGVAIRYGVSGEARLSTTMAIVSLVGVLALGGLAESRLGWEGILGTPRRDFIMMSLAGLFNAIAFLSLTKALQMTSVMFVNALNASQSAMALAAGVLLFGEPLSWALGVGVAMTALGLILMGGKKRSTAATVRSGGNPG